MIYIFDVDGTLTPSSKPIEKDFQNFFIEWASDKNFVLVSGSPYKKIEKQLGKIIISMAESVFPCSGLEQWQNFKPVWHYNYTFPADLYILLEELDLPYEINKMAFHPKDLKSDEHRWKL